MNSREEMLVQEIRNLRSVVEFFNRDSTKYEVLCNNLNGAIEVSSLETGQSVLVTEALYAANDIRDTMLGKMI